MPDVVARDGIRLYYDHARGGPGATDVLLIMGLGLRGQVWGETRERLLEGGFGVVTFDNRGVGGSGSRARPWGTKTMARDAVDILDGLGIARAHVVGVSLGGMVAQELALAHRERVMALGLVSTSGGFPRIDFIPPAAVLSVVTALLNRLRGASPEQRIRGALRVMTSAEYARGVDLEDPRLVVLMESMRGEVSVSGYLGQVWASVAHSAWGRLSGIRVPTLVQHGEQDGMVAVGAGREVARRIPGARLALYPDAGHALSLQEPDSVERLVAFLQRHERAAAPAAPAAPPRAPASFPPSLSGEAHP